MIRCIFIPLLLVYTNGLSQEILEWGSEVNLALDNFKSKETEINDELSSNFIQSGSLMNFSYQMSGYEFMFTKNFNSKVRAEFHENSAAISAVDSTTAQQMVNYAQYSFDLTELYARRVRKELYEVKGAFSNTDFYEPIVDKYQQELVAENARVSKLTQLGMKADLLAIERQKVLQEIETLSEFCLTCKPKKKKKR